MINREVHQVRKGGVQSGESTLVSVCVSSDHTFSAAAASSLFTLSPLYAYTFLMSTETLSLRELRASKIGALHLTTQIAQET